MEIRPIEAISLFTAFGSAECRSKAEASLALAERGGVAREQMLVDAEAWMLLADHLDYIEIALTKNRGGCIGLTAARALEFTGTTPALGSA